MVPMFKRMYAGLGEDLFWLTQALVKLSDSLRFNPEAWILGTLFSVIIIVCVYRLFGWYWLLNLIPGGKRLQQSVQMLFYSRSMEIMLLTGVHAGGTGFGGRDVREATAQTNCSGSGSS